VEHKKFFIVEIFESGAQIAGADSTVHSEADYPAFVKDKCEM